MTKILLVEDDKSLREIYGVRLLAEGYDIVSAGDGEEALAMAIKDRPDLIVSDVMMPKISGFDMLDILRSTTETRDIKVIMMTALSSEDQRQRGVALGADRYLVKSQVGIEDVVRTVHEVLADAPVTGSTPVPTATPAPAQPPVSAPVAPANPAPSVPTAAPAPIPSIAPPQATPAPLPQPTAPFSTPRPANLGDRVIQPLVSDQPQRDFSGMMNEELAAHATQTPVAPEPTPAPASSPVNGPIDITFAQPAASNSVPPSPQMASSLPPVPPAPDSGLSFEETPGPAPSNSDSPQINA